MSGLVKPKEYKISDSNIALMGSDIEKKVKADAAATEKAWHGVGKAPGLNIWRIEKFQVVPVDTKTYGSFYSGDSYILLHTYLKDPSKADSALAWDVHFWLGQDTTQDEAGTAAYKTVEIDDFLGGAPIQHREVQGSESDLFMKYFNNNIRILEGGIESGFNYIKPAEFKPKLLHLKGVKKVRVTEVPTAFESLNEGDAFVLDCGLDVYQWQGKSAGVGEKMKARELTTNLKSERKGQTRVHVLEAGETGEDMEKFYSYLKGTKDQIKTAAQGGSDKEADAPVAFTRSLYRISDASGKMEFTEISKGNAVKKNQLDKMDVFLLDSGKQLFIWVGSGSTKEEKHHAMNYAVNYLQQFGRPTSTPITRVLEGQESKDFEEAFR